MNIKRDGGTWSWINFKYERLSTFCFVYEILGYTKRDCNVVNTNLDKKKSNAPMLDGREKQIVTVKSIREQDG